MSLPFIKSNNGSLTVIAGNRTYAVPFDHVNYKALKDAVVEGDEKKFLKNINVAKALQARSGGKVQVVGGEVLYNGKPIHNVVCDRILDFMQQGLPFQPLINFLEKLQENPSKQSVDQLYLFLEACGLTICDDGDFLGFKSVTPALLDHYTKSIKNVPGAIIEMPRNQVDDNRNSACSHGYHVGTEQYANTFGYSSSVILMVKVNPRDAVSVPADHNNAKLRCCRYEVVKEIPRNSGYAPLYTSSGDVYQGDDDSWDDEDIYRDYEDEVVEDDDYEATSYTESEVDDLLDETWQHGFEAGKKVAQQTSSNKAALTHKGNRNSIKAKTQARDSYGRFI